MKKIWLFILGLFTLLFALNFSFAKDYEYTNYDINADILIDGTINVQEDITANFFVQKHGIFRSIPLNYSTEGINFHIDVSNINVKGKKFSTNKANGEIEIKIGDANISLIGEQDYPISYSTYGLIRNFSGLGYAELYWNLVGYDFDTNINKVHAVINLPKTYTGFTDEDFLITTNGDTVSIGEFQGTINRSQGDKIIINYNKALPAFQGITLAIKFPNNYFEFDHSKQKSLLGVIQPGTSSVGSTSPEKGTHKKLFFQSIIDFIENFLLLLLIPIILLFFLCPPIGSLAIFLSLRLLFNAIIQTITKTIVKIRSIRGGGLTGKLAREFPIVVQYTPPDNISPAEASLLIHRHAEPVALISLIYKWAAEGLISIESGLNIKDSGDNKKEIKYITIKKIGEIDELAPYYEKTFFNSISYTKTIPTNKGINFFKSLLPIGKDITNITINSKDLYALELYGKKMKWFTTVNIENYLKTLLFILFCTLLVLIPITSMSGGSIRIIILLIILIFATGLHSGTYNKITKSGAEVLSHVLGYRKFLQKCDENQLRLLLEENPLFVNNIISYATIFGIESELIKKITPIMNELNIKVTWCNSDLYSMNNIASSLRNYTSPQSSTSWGKGLSFGGGSTSYSSDSGFSGGSSFGGSSSSSSSSSGGGGFSSGGGGGGGGGRSW